jgi:DNA-binding transcriptional regulator YiaG
MTQHEQWADVRVVHEYNMDTLGAPFRITLLDSVTVRIDRETGEEDISVPDPVGLINAVVRSRVTHPRKLSGEEIAFVRKALGVRAKRLADFLSMSPEHLSRCESGSKAMSAPAEKLLRLFAFLGTFSKNPVSLLNKCPDIKALRAFVEKAPSKDAQKILAGFLRVFLEMKIKALFDPAEELHIRLVRRVSDDHCCGPEDDGEWDDELAIAA